MYVKRTDDVNDYCRGGIFSALHYCRTEFTTQEMYGLSCILRRLATAFPTSCFTALDSGQLSLLVQLLSRLSVVCAQHTAQEEVCVSVCACV